MWITDQFKLSWNLITNNTEMQSDLPTAKFHN